MKQAVLYKKLAHGVVQCTACAWGCRIKPGFTGVCGTRLNQNGQLDSLVYGQAIGLHLDPVEKKPLFHFLPGSTLLSFGTVGCNFGCDFCQNYTMSQASKGGTYQVQGTKSKDTTSLSPKEIVARALQTGAVGIAYTYNEPTVFAEYAHDTAVIAHKVGLKNVWVSNGFQSPETFDYIKETTDAINIDLKSNRDEFYRRVCHAQIGPIKDNIKRFYDAHIETEVTTLVIPGQNDSDRELTGIARFLQGVGRDIPWHISAFHPDYQMQDAPETPVETLRRAYAIGKKAGLKYIYVGNTIDPERESSWCPKCESLLVGRRGYQVAVTGLKTGTGICTKCGEKIYGTFA